MFYLHEKCYFHEDAFWDYYNSVISITRIKINSKLENESTITKAIVYTQKQILKQFIHHLSPNDLYEIEKFPSEKLHLFIERLGYMLEGYFNGFVINEDLFDDDLKNPKYK